MWLVGVSDQGTSLWRFWGSRELQGRSQYLYTSLQVLEYCEISKNELEFETGGGGCPDFPLGRITLVTQSLISKK